MTSTPAASGFPWPDLLRIGLGSLRLPPDLFWALTPRELLMLAGLGASRVGELDVGALRALLAAELGG